MSITQSSAAAESMPKPQVVRLRPDIKREQQEDALTGAMADTERMASILTTLLEERLRDIGSRAAITVARQDAEDIRFAAGQLLTMLGRAGETWRALS